MDWSTGDLVWFDPSLGHPLPGEILEVHRAAQVIIVQALINGKNQTFTLGPGEGNLRSRQDLGKTGVEDMTQLDDLHEASLLWNLKLRYDNGLIYTYAGSILIAVNPYKMVADAYGIEMAKTYSGKQLGALPPHLFAIGSAAHAALPSSQVVVISGESGSGKTESTKLVMQYLAAVVPGGGSASTVITEQILEAAPLLEAFGNARTSRNDNSSRFGKYLEVFFKSGAIIGAKITQYLLEKSRIVTQAPGERNYHVFYELLGGLPEIERVKYGLLEADKYFYLNQGGSDCSPGRVDWVSLQGAMQVLGVSENEREGIVNVLASVLHLGNIYFHRRQLRHGQEGVEIGSEAEIKWAAHLLKIPSEGILRSLTSRITETRSERLYTPLSIDQALDARDALAKALYSGLFNWLVLRINSIVYKGGAHDAHRISILDIFGFENLDENSFEQLCINYANESLQLYFNKHVFKLEQAEYLRERLEWSALEWEDNLPVIHLLAKKPVGVFHLLDDESNFPRANDLSFLEKCHYNHALNELYSRPRIGAQEFGIMHYAGQVWYSVEGFLEKNRDALRMDVIELLSSSSDPLVGDMTKQLKAQRDIGKTLPRGINGRFVTMKPRTPTVAARFSDSLQQLLQSMAKCNPWFVRCVKPNNDKQALRMDMPCVLQQLRYLGMLDTIKIRQCGYPVRLRFQHFVERYKHMLRTPLPRGTPYRELCRFVLDSLPGTNTEGPDFQLGATRVFLRESIHRVLEASRSEKLRLAAIIIQKNVRGLLTRKRMYHQQRGAITIQKIWRGYRERKKYVSLKTGIIKAQAFVRGHMQRVRYSKFKTDLMNQREAEQRLQKESLHIFAKEQNAASASYLLDIPAELAFIFTKSENWSGQQNDRLLVKVVGTVPGPPSASDIPSDLDQFSFGKFSSVYCNGNQISSRYDIISMPFMSRAAARDQDFKDAILIYKLIIKWTSDSATNQNRQKIMADYIVHKGLFSKGLRDEILVQICNQIQCSKHESSERLWLLMSHCLSAFQPGSVFSKYLIKFIVDNAPQHTKEHLLKKVLRSENGSHSNHCRILPPSWLEWRASSRLADTALVLIMPDGVMQTVAVDSWTTCEEAAALAISSLGIPNLGWTVVIEENGLYKDSSGIDYVLDLVSEKEVCPVFPSARMTSDQLKCDSKNIHIAALESDSSPKRPQVPPPEPPPTKRLSILQASSIQNDLTHNDSKVDRHEINPKYTQHTESLARKSSHDAFSSNKSGLHNDYFESDKTKSRSLDDLLVSDKNDMISLTEPVSLKYRMNDHFQSNDETTPLKEPQPRYVKSQYAGKRSAGSHSSKYMERTEMSIRSSAMSDTSEAPSLASHVRRVRVPSQASDVDQFLDDLFSPVLDGSLDELSDARSLATSIRGSSIVYNETGTLNYVGMLLSSIQSCSSLSSLNYGSGLHTSIKGGGTAHQQKNSSTNGFTQNTSGLNSSSTVPTVSSNALLIMSPANSDTIVPTFNIPVGVDNVAYQQQVQRAFLQSAMAQNIQIQQQLIAQNQALQTLLIQQDTPTSPTINNSASKHNAAPVPPSTPQMFNRKSSIKTRPDSSLVSISEMMRNRKDSSSASLIPPPPPPPLPPPLEMKDPLEARPFLDPYGRAKTVRIGKWRWPPPQDAAGGEVDDNFIQFKIRYANRKTTPQSQTNSNIESPISSPSGIDWDEFEIDSQILNTTTCTQSIPDQKSNQKVAKRSFDIGADRPLPNSVGKLKLSNEMRQRLEQVTAGHSIRSTSTHSDRTERVPAKLEDTRRMILEQQLGGIMSNKSVADLPSVKTQVQRMESDKRSPVWPSVLPPAPSGPAPPPPIRPPNTMPPAPPPPLYSGNSNTSSQILPTLQDIPSFVQRQERDTFGAKENFNDTWNRAEAAKLELVYETNFTKETSIQRERSRSRSRSRDREIFSESVWDRSEVEGPSSSASDRENKEREKREKKYEISQIQREKESNKVYQPPHPKDRLKSINTYNNNKQSVATFKTHMVKRSVQEKERKSSATTISPINNGHLDESNMISQDPPVPVMPLPTQLNQPASACLTYNNVTWKLNVRKEIFRPNESVNAPAAIDLIFLQITSDLFDITPCLRIMPQDRRNAITFLSSHGLTRENLNIPLRTVVKRHLLDMARAWPLYFSRMFALNSSHAIPTGTILAVSHTAVYLARKEHDFISVQKTIPFCEIKDITMMSRISTFQLTMVNENKYVLHTTKATAIQSMIQSFVAEYRQTQSKGTTISSGVRAAAATLNVPLERLEISTNSPNSPNHSTPTETSQNVTGACEIMYSDNNLNQQQGHEITLSQKSPSDYSHHGYSKHTANSMGSTYVFNSHKNSSPTPMYKLSLLQFAIHHFRNDGKDSKIKRNDLVSSENNLHVDLVKWQGHPLQSSLLRLPPDLTNFALECFNCILRYCGDLIPDPDLTEVKCVYTVLMHCHKHLILRDEVYCQLIKQTTSNSSSCPESAQRAWRLLSILAAYFGCSDALRPYLIEHLTSAASDRHLSCHGTAAVCLTNLRKTARCGGRKNVPSVEEVTAVSAGRSARRQIYRLPGGAERIVNTRCSTVVGDVIVELCSLLGIEVPAEQQEFSLYCIVQGDAFTMPLAADEYILDVTTELLKSGQPFYLIFCRSVWHFPLKRDPAPTPLYIEVLFNQVAPDYLEGLLLELPNGGAPTPDYIRDMAKIAAILHRAADLNHLPAMKEIKFLLPKPALSLRELRPAQWVALVQSAWPSVAGLSPIQVKAQFLNVLSSWPLFGSSFFAVKRIWSEEALAEETSPLWRELILALNRRGVLFLDPNTHETLQHWPFNDVISTRKVRSEDGALFLDMKVGNLLQQRVIRVQTEQAHEISRLVRQYITMAQAQLRERRE